MRVYVNLMSALISNKANDARRDIPTLQLRSRRFPNGLDAHMRYDARDTGPLTVK